MQMWVMSDRAIPRSYRMMQGFGVHTFRMVNEAGESRVREVPLELRLPARIRSTGTRRSRSRGADPDFHRRDLWEAIEAGAYPEWELGLQIFTEEQAEQFSFDVLDATKIVPEELVPVQPVGRMVLNRNPDNFFAETEQVAFCTAHIVPGLDFTNDPLLAGRIHSYVDTQISRLGGPNFHEIPINAPDRAGAQQPARRHAPAGHSSRPRGLRAELARRRLPVPGRLRRLHVLPAAGAKKTRCAASPRSFADHYTQATLFWNSQTPVEKAHIIRAFRFELTRVQVPAIRERVVSQLANVADELAQARGGRARHRRARAAAEGVARSVAKPEVKTSPALSLVRASGRRQHPHAPHRACWWPTASMAQSLTALHDSAVGARARCRASSARGSGAVADCRAATPSTWKSRSKRRLRCCSMRWSLPDGAAAVEALGDVGQALEFVKDQYRHCKPILALGAGAELLAKAGIPPTLPSGEPDPGLLHFEAAQISAGDRSVHGGHR